MKIALFKSSLRAPLVRIVKIESILILFFFALATTRYIVNTQDPCYYAFHVECTTTRVQDFLFALAVLAELSLVITHVIAITAGVRAMRSKQREEPVRVLLNDTLRVSLGMPLLFAVFWVAWSPATHRIARSVDAVIRFVEDVRR